MIQKIILVLGLLFVTSSAFTATFQCHRVQGSSNGSSSYDVLIEAESLSSAVAQNQLWARSGQFRVAGACYPYNNPRACGIRGQACSIVNNWCCSQGLACLSAGAGSNYGICQ